MPDFLLEIGCEEIPARMIDAASQELRERVHALLTRERLPASDEISALDTPRRLAVLAPGIPAAQQDIVEQATGPSVSIAYKNGAPTPAALAFAKKSGVEVEQLTRVTTAKGEYISASVTRRGRGAAELLAEYLPKELASIQWPKSMYWRKPSERFVRPVRWLVAMLDGEVIPLEFDGVVAGSQSRGHRLLADGNVTIPSAGSAYVAALTAAKVLSRSDREQQIRQQLDAATRTIPGARWREDVALLDTVTNLTEFPAVVMGTFDPEFLALPDEVLVTVMRDHQKYFAIEDADDKLLPHFLAVLNTDGDPEGIIRHGHERVLRARFNDARFFWQTDQKHDLRRRVSWLKQLTFQKDLGSYYEKTVRVQAVCRRMSHELRSYVQANDLAKVRAGIVHKAAWLAKADLTTELVKEFTELQGVIGGLYAQVQELDHGMPEATRLLIANTIYDQYKPQSADDKVPRTVEGAVLSVADKADTIVGMFALGLAPTGSKDPVALRRQANGIVRILAEHKLPLRFSLLLACARAAYHNTAAEKRFRQAESSTLFDETIRFGVGYDPASEREFDSLPPDETALALSAFFKDRVEFHLRTVLGFEYDIVNAVLARGFDQMVDTIRRAEALKRARSSEDFAQIAIAFKRTKNILRQAKEKDLSVGLAPIPADMTEAAEKQLFNELFPLAEKVQSLREAQNYDAALMETAKIRPAVDAFFDHVMVMVDDDNVRQNRLALLQALLREFSTIADFSEIVNEGNESQTSIQP